MTVKEFYEGIGGSYDEAVGRLMNDGLIHRFVLKFKDDPNFSELKPAINEMRWDDAFLHAHTLKGVVMNLAFSRLSESAKRLCDSLRPENRSKLDPVNVKKLFCDVENDYNEVVTQIDNL